MPMNSIELDRFFSHTNKYEKQSNFYDILKFRF